MVQCSTCGAINRDDRRKCGICGAQIIPGRQYTRPPTPGPTEEEVDILVVPHRTRGRAMVGFLATILVIASGIITSLSSGTVGLVLGLVLIIVGVSLGLSVVRYLRTITTPVYDGEDRSR